MTGCSVCQHEALGEIDRRLLEGEHQRALASQYGVSRAAMGRHARGHLATTLAQAVVAVSPEVLEHARATVSHGEHALAVFQRSLGTLEGLIDHFVMGLKDKDGKYLPLTPATVASTGRLLGLLHQHVLTVARIQSVIAETAEVDLAASPEWRELLGVLLDALEPYPEALDAVLTALPERYRGPDALA